MPLGSIASLQGETQWTGQRAYVSSRTARSIAKALQRGGENARPA